MKNRVFLTTVFVLFSCFVASVIAADKRALNEQQIRQADDVLKMLMRRNIADTDTRSFSAWNVRINSEGTSTISGRVYGLDDREYETAWVEAFSVKNDPPSPDGDDFYKGISAVDREGMYTIEELPSGEYYVIAYAEGFELLYYENVVDMADATIVAVSEGNSAEGIDFKMRRMTPGTAAVSGQVADAATGEPLANAAVYAYSFERGYWYNAFTDALGEYAFRELKAGNYYLQVWAEDYLGQYYNQKQRFEDADLLAVADSANISGIDFKLERAGSISGVVNDLQGHPIAGVYLYATPVAEIRGEPKGGDNSYGKAVTDDKGRYVISGLMADDYAVQLELWTIWSYITMWYDQKTLPDEADPVRVVTGMETTGIDFVLDYTIPQGVLSGRVTDSDGGPIENAYIWVMSAESDRWFYAYAMSDRNGNYSIFELPDGSYYISAGVQSGWQYVSRWWPDALSMEDALPLSVSESSPAIADFVLPIVVGRSSIAGRVTDVNGRPLAWVNISISPAQAGDPQGSVISSVWAWGYTDEQGYYTVKQLPAGEYKVYAACWEEMNYGEQWWNSQPSEESADVLRLNDDQHRDNVDFSLNLRPVYGSISGLVVDAQSGAPIERALVEITPKIEDGWNNYRRFYWRTNSAITDQNGQFAVDWLFEGDYLVSVYANGAFEYFDKAAVVELATPVKVVGGQKSPVDFKLTPRRDGAAGITGRVLMEGSQTPFEIAVVTAKPSHTILTWPESELFYTAVTDSMGNFTLNGLPEKVEFYIYAFSNWTIGEYYEDVYDPNQATLVAADGVKPTVLKDIELPVYRRLGNGPEDDQKGVANAVQVVGVVKDGDGNGIVGARIIAFNESSQPAANGRSSIGGYFEISGLSPGNYILQASREGYGTSFNGNATSMSAAQPINLSAGVLQVDFVLSFKTGIVDNEKQSALPKNMQLLGNYPNPFNPQTRIAYVLPKTQEVRLAIYNLAGGQVTTLVAGTMEAGFHEAVWNGRDDSGRAVSSGVYLVRLVSWGEQLTGKLILMK